MTAYAIGHLRPGEPHDDVIRYIERIQATLDPFGGRFLVHGAQVEVIEGQWPGALVVIGFPDLAAVHDWYASAAYQDILPLRTEHLDGDVVFVNGVGPDYDPAHTAARLKAPTTPGARGGT